jgi:hypothetical protein
MGFTNFKLCTTPNRAAVALATAFWDAEGVISVYITPHGKTINSGLYLQTLKTLQMRFTRVRPQKNDDEINQHETFTELGWTVLPHPPYIQDLAPLNFQLF